jgi:hypothetical protein
MSEVGAKRTLEERGRNLRPWAQPEHQDASTTALLSGCGSHAIPWNTLGAIPQQVQPQSGTVGNALHSTSSPKCDAIPQLADASIVCPRGASSKLATVQTVAFIACPQPFALAEHCRVGTPSSFSI